MERKVFRTGNSMVISLPREALEYLNLQEGMTVEVNLDRENRQVILKPVEPRISLQGVDEAFARQVSDFIEQYRPALEKLAK